MNPSATKPIYRSKAFLVGLIGFFGILGVWVDSCSYATSWNSQIIPKHVSTNCGIMKGTVAVGILMADAGRTGPVYWHREPHDVGFGPEMETVVSWNGGQGMMQIRVWKLVAMYLAYWSVIVAWRIWSYGRAARAPRPM